MPAIRFCSAMEQLKEVPVHVHCIANYRVSAFFYRYRRDVLGMDDLRPGCACPFVVRIDISEIDATEKFADM
jgi:hypothetical protein